jgi:predicted AAA+ superfamily ATPase
MKSSRFTRTVVPQTLDRLVRHGKYICFLIGPRQCGKTTAAGQVAALWAGPTHRCSVEESLLPKPGWLTQQAAKATALARQHKKPCLWVVDEVQKAPRWSEELKGIWDREQREPSGLRILALGSSALLVQKGMSESLAGRFLLTRVSHWSWPEMRKAFAYTLEDYLVFGGYPAGAGFRREPDLWQAFVRDSMIETILARDVLNMHAIRNPILLRNVFAFAASHPAQVVALEKIIGHFQETGNTATVAQYLRLLESGFLISGLSGWRGGAKVQRSGRPKLLVWNQALIHGVEGLPAMPLDPARRGRLVENAVGAHILNQIPETERRLWYWREKDLEVDYVLETKGQVWGIEVKSGRRHAGAGLAAFAHRFPKASLMEVGSQEMPLERFLESNPSQVFAP